MYQALTLKTLGFFLIWLFLSESLAPFHLVLGLAVAFGVAWFNTDRPTPTTGVAVLGRVVWYFPWLLGRVLHSGIHMSRLVLNPAMPIDPKLIRQPTRLREGAGVVLLGNSITLTPGTITVEVDGGELIVHAIDDASADDVTSLRIERRIARIFGEKGTA